MGRYWKPLIPLRFVERDGKKILQQAWGLYRPALEPDYESQVDHEWRDVPLMPEEKGSGKEWCQDES